MLKIILICYCAFAYGFEFNNALNMLVDDELYEEYSYPYIIPVVLLVVFLLGPIIMPFNWLVNTIRYHKGK